MLTCRELAHRHASDYLDGQLGWRGRVGVWFHLMRCDYCRRFIAQLRKVRVLLRNASQHPNPLQSNVGVDPATEELAYKLAEVYATQKKFSPPL
jgi:predicted anti-sigma-YlaC factor YlaD